MLIEELKEIVRKEQDVIPFLKKLSLNAKEKKAFVAEIKQLRAVIFERKEVREKNEWGISTSFKQTHTDAQEKIINLACFVLFNKTDARQTFSHFLIDDDVIQHVLPWYIPKWYSDLVNEANPWRLDYDKLIYLYENNYLEPSKALVVAKLPGTLVKNNWENSKNRMFYQLETLFINSVTLQIHIWYLFEEESSINFHNYILDFENYKKVDDVWIHTITNLVEEQKIDRTKTLIATIYTSTKGFNKNLSGWFFDLLIGLNPTKEEVLSLQDEFYAALNSPHSKVVNTVLKYFKIAAVDKKFKHTDFIENASILLSSEVKSVVNSTLMILDKIAKINKSLHIDICKKASEALLNSDEKIQVRAAKIIAKYGDVKDEELCDEIAIYTDNLFYAPKEIINEYIQTESLEIVEEEEIVEVHILSSETKLPVYEDFDDIFFFVNQVLDNNEPYHLDLLLVYLPKLNLFINQQNVSRLAPLLKRSFDMAVSYEWSHQHGYLEVMASYLINDFGKMLLKKYPAELASFWQYKDKKLKEIDRARRRRYQATYENQMIHDHVYNIYRFLLMQTKEYIVNNQAFEFLSTPTHEPCWIDPETFVDRLLVFQNKIVQYEFYDFQIALGRIPIVEITDAIAHKIERIQSKEIKAVLYYHFGKKTLQESAILRPKAWMQSVLTRKVPEEITYFESKTSYSLKREIANYQWVCGPVERIYKVYNYQEGKYEQEKTIEKHLHFADFDQNLFKDVSLYGKIKNIFFSKKKVFGDESIYKLLYFIKEKYVTTIRPKDDVKFLYLAPSNPSPFLAQIIFHSLKESKLHDEGSKKNMVNVLKGLYKVWYRKDYGEATYLFLATGFLCSDKVAREITAEIWIKASSEATMNHVLLGNTIGKLQFGEYAPMKRLTDIIALNMFNVSKKHNTYLFKFIDAIIQEMNDTPIRGLKKLLELFLELKRSLSNTIISEETKEKLQTWEANKTLKAVIEKLV